MALTKVNSVGIATGISLTGITTTQDTKVGSGITLSPDGHGYYTGIVTATSYRGDVSNCTGVGQTNFLDAESLNVSVISTFGGAISGTTATFSGNITANGNIVGDDSTNISGINDVIATSLYTSDSIIHRGENADNTQIRFPADDTVTIQTDGNERLRIDDNGRVVIGDSATASPTGILHIYQASNDPYIYIQRGSGDAANAIGGIIWKNSTNNLGQIVVNSADINDSNMAFKTMLAGTLTEAFRIDNNGRLLIGSQRTYSDQSYYDDITINNSDGSGASGGTGITLISDSGSWGAFLFGDEDDNDDGSIKYDHSNNIMRFTTGTTDTFQINATTATFAGSVSDSKGDVRKIIYQNKTSGYTLVAADAGKAIHISTGGVTINDSLFSAGDAVTIINNSGSDQTITQGSGVTLYDTGDDGSTGNKTLKGRGMATVWFSSASVGYISGNF